MYVFIISKVQESFYNMQMVYNIHDIQNKVITYDKKTKTQKL